DYDDNNWGPAADVLYAIWPKERGSRAYLLAQFTMDIFANIPNGPNDTFTFSTQAMVTNDVEAAKSDVEKINVFPNPYYAQNPEETSRFERFVTFTHLPQKATIRIFTLSGVQVRKLEKDDPSQFLNWDLRNESSLPVASGIYIAHIDMPELGKTKVLKLFIIQAAEILEFF
ncbi:MAG: T9SS C-terminal target domain-containing protein, partial [Calditrichaeota bacterium]